MNVKRSQRDNPILTGFAANGARTTVELFKDAVPQCGLSCATNCLYLVYVADSDYPGRELDGYYCGATGAYIPFTPKDCATHIKNFGGVFGNE